MNLLTLDFTMTPEAAETLAAQGIPLHLVTTLPSGTLVYRVVSTLDSADEVQADLQKRTGGEAVHLVIDVEEVSTTTVSAFLPLGWNAHITEEAIAGLVGQEVDVTWTGQAIGKGTVKAASRRSRPGAPETDPGGVWVTVEVDL